MKKQFLTALVIVLCAAPFATSALTGSDVQSRINELLAKIAELNLQIRSLQGQAVVTTPSGTTPNAWGLKHRVCTVLDRSITQGQTNDDVKSVQEFLKQEGYLNAEASGFFGNLTKEALVRWQASQGVIATADARIAGAGLFGPKTKDRLRVWCGGNGTSGTDLTATPQKGGAPLTVTFTSKIGDGTTRPSAYDGQDTVLDFGDGSEAQWISCGETDNAMQQRCANPVSLQHTYSKDGTYTATLKKVGGFCAPPGCPVTVIAKVQITVGSIACTKEYRPVCGMKQVVCITAPCNPVPTTYSNTCMMEADGASFAYEGQCRTGSTDPSADAQCKSWYDGCNSCGRSEPGGPAFCTLKACPAATIAKNAYCTAYFGGSGSGKAPSISGFSGPTSLTTNQSGTWTVKASDPEGQQLSYYITWGDENNYASGLQTSLPVFTQTATFTHSYAVAGTYTVQVIARDAEGKEAKASITVRVSSESGSVACTMEYAPVCGRPAGCANTCAPGMICPAICQLHDAKTYGNRCSLNAAGAEYLHDGECQQ
ncbi:peptidoglycan-binding protein [bacterium]|nr:peptidoglycan-binding protein [bacterium]